MTATVGKYVLERRIAVGGMAEIFLASLQGIEDFSKRVVIKHLLPDLADDPDFLKMFIDEARLAAQLDHPNVVQVHELGSLAGRYFIAMEYVPGLNLAQLQERVRATGKAIPEHVAVAIIAAVLRGLHYAHEKRDEHDVALGLVHRDVAPQNILLSFEGAVKVTDFGIAQARGRLSRTRTGTLKGRFAYMAPEQARGDTVDRRGDVFSAGVLLLDLLAGAPVEDSGDDEQQLRSAQTAEWHTRRIARLDASPTIKDVLARALAANPDARFASARAMEEALPPIETRAAAELTQLLRAVRSADDVPPPSPRTQPSLHTLPRKRRALALALASLAATSLLIGAWALLRAQPSTTVLVEQPASAPTSAPVVPEPVIPQGYLTLNSSPWSYVWIDGKKQPGSTPMRLIALPLGPHKVRLESPGAGRSETFTVDIRPGTTVRMVDFGQR
jgi:eukaryotic-like serine/threonine-protein kinase